MDVDLREYVEAMLKEKDRATQIAEREREKAATILADALAASIMEGDARLREHIENQVQQINAALVSNEKLSLARMAKLESDRESLVQAMDNRSETTERALEKAEIASEKRFDGVNEFRGQLSDQAATFIPREVAETQFAEFRKALAHLTERQDRTVGHDQGVGAEKLSSRAVIGLWIAGAAVFVGVITIVITILATSGAPVK